MQHTCTRITTLDAGKCPYEGNFCGQNTPVTMAKNANELKDEKKLITEIKTPNKQAKHARHINQQTSKQISLLIRSICPNIGQVGRTKHMLAKSHSKIQKGLCKLKKQKTKTQQVDTISNLITCDKLPQQKHAT